MIISHRNTFGPVLLFFHFASCILQLASAPFGARATAKSSQTRAKSGPDLIGCMIILGLLRLSLFDRYIYIYFTFTVHRVLSTLNTRFRILVRGENLLLQYISEESSFGPHN